MDKIRRDVIDSEWQGVTSGVTHYAVIRPWLISLFRRRSDAKLNGHRRGTQSVANLKTTR